MIGNLTIDKASMNISYFLKTIRIIADNNGRVSRGDFVRQMADFIGAPASIGGKENRTPYNKSKLPRYFGFVDIEKTATQSFLILTNRGNRLANYILENAEAPADQRYTINPENREDFINIIFESVIFGSFGKNNCGAEQSNTDVEPPKIVFKTLLELGRATAEEICYVMFALNKGVFNTFSEAIDKVKENRSLYQYDYSKIMEEWEVTNIVNDCKIINMFTDENIKLLRSERDEEIGKTFYYLNSSLSQYHRDQIATISPIYQPLKMLVYSNSNSPTMTDWVNNAILGGVSDNSFVFRYTHGNSFIGETINGEYAPGIFEQALLKAFMKPNKNVYLIFDNTSESRFVETFGEYYPLLERIDDLQSEKHGWSAKAVPAPAIYEYLKLNTPVVRSVLETGTIRFPSNLQIVGTIIMNEITGKENFDYTFTKCLVSTVSQAAQGDDAGTASVAPSFPYEICRGGAQNKVVYGTPGCGKSYYVQNTFLPKIGVAQKHRIRTTFYQDYTNTDFVGQILPKVHSDKSVTYEFNPGPFSLALKMAFENPNHSVALIIEELNRGNAASIFGDTFQLLDRDETGKSQYEITNVNLQDYLNKAFEGTYSFASIRIPANLTIVATMNTSDQNVFTLDTAFKRRWQFEKIKNVFLDDHEYKDYYVPGMADVTWEKLVTAINEYIISRPDDITSEDKQLGVYFIDKSTLCEKQADCIDAVKISKFAYKLFEYLWDDVAKFAHADWFGTDVRTLDELIDKYTRVGKNVFVNGIL